MNERGTSVSRRHALVIGSTCDVFPVNPLDSVGADTENLFDALTDDARGGCQFENSMLLLHPTMTTMAQAIKSAVHRAAQDRASLVLTFLGHAALAGTDHTAKSLYLLPRDGSETPDSDTGYELGRRLTELLGSSEAYGLDGLLVMLDVCHGGVGLLNCAQDAAAVAAESNVRLEMLAAVFDQVARHGCFTKTLTHAIQTGIPALSSDFITTVEAADWVAEQCTNAEEPLRFAMARGRRVASDPSLWIAKNPGAFNTWSLAGTHAGGLAVELTRTYQPTDVVSQALTTIEGSFVTFLQGPAGAGKSALVGALSRPNTAPKLIPSAYLAATAFGALTATIEDLATELHRQLMQQQAFRDASQRYVAGFEYQRELQIQPQLQRLVLGPLTHVCLEETDRMRIAIDSIDLFAPSSRDEILRAVTRCVASRPTEWQVRFLITHREDLPTGQLDPEAGSVVMQLEPPGKTQIRRFLSSRGLQETAVALVAENAQSWLDVIVLYEALDSVETDHLAEAGRLDQLYDIVLGPVIADPEARSLITVLATSVAGPVMPWSVLIGVSSIIGGPTEPGVVGNIVTEFGRWVARSKPGTPDERLGICHESLLNWFLRQEEIRSGLDVARDAVLEHLQAATEEAARQYRRDFEAEHLWQRRCYSDAVELVGSQCGSKPVDNIALIRKWVDRAETTLPVDDPAALQLRSELARWTGRSGALGEAITLCEEVIRGRTGTLGADHPSTLRSRLMLTSFLGRAGDSSAALRMSKHAHALCKQVFGPDEPISMEAETEVARWTGECGAWEDCLKYHQAVFARREQVLGADHRDTHKSRGNIAHVLGRLGKKADAASAYAALAEDESRLYGPNDPDVLNARLCEVRWRGASGDRGTAVRLAFELIPVNSEVFGPDDPKTLNTWTYFAEHKAGCGHLQEAIQAYNYVIPRLQRVLEPTAPQTLYARVNRASAVARGGDLDTAIAEIEAAVREYAELLGPDHAAVLFAREGLAYWTAASGAVAQAILLFKLLIEDRERILGPNELGTRRNKKYLATLRKTGRARLSGKAIDLTSRDGTLGPKSTLNGLLESQGRKSRLLKYSDFSLDQVHLARVSAVVNFGAFVDVGGFIGLVHISELSWHTLRHPSEMVMVGDELTVAVKRLDDDLRRVEFSLKRAQTDPLLDFYRSNPIGSRLVATVTRLHRRSAEVALPSGLFGSSLDAEGDLEFGELRVGQDVPVRIEDIDPVRRSIRIVLLAEDDPQAERI